MLKWKYYIKDYKNYHFLYQKHKNRQDKKKRKTKWQRKVSYAKLDPKNSRLGINTMKTIMNLRMTLWNMGLDTIIYEKDFPVLVKNLKIGYFDEISMEKLKALLRWVPL